MTTERPFVYDADQHITFSLEHTADLAPEFHSRRPRIVHVEDGEGLGRHDSSYLFEGRLLPSTYGPGTNPGNFPKQKDLVESGLYTDTPFLSWSWGAQTLTDPGERIVLQEKHGVDVSVLYPSTIYAQVADDPALEASLYRAYNSFLARQTGYDRSKLRYAGLLPLRDRDQAFAAIEEMLEGGASAALVYGTAGAQFLHDPTFTPIFNELERVGLPVAIHAGQSYRPLNAFGDTLYRAISVGFTVPAILAFSSLTAGGLLDRHPGIKWGFLEFGSEWLLYLVTRGDKYRELSQAGVYHTDLPEQAIVDYTRSDRFFISGEADSPYLPLELELVGDGGWLFASDLPHDEGREFAADAVLTRDDLTDEQKRLIIGANAAQFYREP